MDARIRQPKKVDARDLQGETSRGCGMVSLGLGCRGTRIRAVLWRWRRTELAIAVTIAVLFIAAEIRPPCLWSYLVLKRYPTLISSDRTDITLVTAYFNLGSFETVGRTFSFYKYLHWAGVYQYVLNPLVVYTDSEQVENMFLERRKHLANRTHVVRVTRSSLASFDDVEKIRQIFLDPNYPTYYPNTVIPEYPCTQHAKYELVKNALDRNYFSSTRYIAWIDIGYFRYLTKRKRHFFVTVPPGMDESKIAMNQVGRPDWSLYPSDIFRGNLVWVGGGLSIATRPVYRQFTEEYQKSAKDFLNQGLSSTDQQVIYSMFTDVHTLMYRLQSRIQVYTWVLDDIRDCWFYLGYLCYREVD